MGAGSVGASVAFVVSGTSDGICAGEEGCVASVVGVVSDSGAIGLLLQPVSRSKQRKRQRIGSVK